MKISVAEHIDRGFRIRLVNFSYFLHECGILNCKLFRNYFIARPIFYLFFEVIKSVKKNFHLLQHFFSSNCLILCYINVIVFIIIHVKRDRMKFSQFLNN
uniref:Uncharacterized protein n=1 Tax=Lutzomyia longipalpis TaxID=7200 RepID=A0A7G3B547_LUTLO